MCIFLEEYGMAEDNAQSEESAQEKLARDRYRFEGIRYSLQGSSTNGPSEFVPEIISLFAFPRPLPKSEE